MIRYFVFALFLGLANQSLALSCMPVTPKTMYHWANEAKEIYVPVYGRFFHDQTKQLKPVQNSAQLELPKGYEIPGKFVGRYVTRTGLGSKLEINITINVTCVAHWCGGPPGSNIALAVMERDGDDYTLHQHACGGSILYDPDTVAMSEFRQCLAGQPCDPFKN